MFSKSKDAVMAFGLLLVTAFLFLPSLAMAAVPAEVLTGIGDAVTDVAAIGGPILGVIIAIVGFNWLRRVIK